MNIYVATLDTGGISYSGREFIAIGKTKKGAENALVKTVRDDGWPDIPTTGRIQHTFAALHEYFGVEVVGPIEPGSGVRL